jgi:hypothetical protein
MMVQIRGFNQKVCVRPGWHQIHRRFSKREIISEFAETLASASEPGKRRVFIDRHPAESMTAPASGRNPVP